MAIASEAFNKCSVKIKIEIAGSPHQATGFLYNTSPGNRFNYVFTAKHALKEHFHDEQIFFEQIGFVDILWKKDKSYHSYEKIPSKTLIKRIVQFDKDLVLIQVIKKKGVDFPIIQVCDEGVEDCYAYGFPEMLDNMPLKLLRRQAKRYTLPDFDDATGLKGISGSGIIAESSPYLQGFIMLHPTPKFEGKLIDAVDISFEEINTVLENNSLEQLSIRGAKGKKRAIREEFVVDISNVRINDVIVDLPLAARRLSFDLFDDWYHDPLYNIDLNNLDYLFDHFSNAFNGDFQTQIAEVFYTPKSNLTLRKALVSPYSDRVYYTALVEILGNSINKSLKRVVYSSRYNVDKTKALVISGIEQWLKMKYKIKDLAAQYNYVLEIDILNFYDNIDITLLCQKLSAISENPNERKAVESLKTILNTFLSNSGRGIPQNSDASSLLATFYLNEIDISMMHLAPSYIRFMDDIRIFCTDEFEARRILSLVEIELRNLKLSLNGEKTKIRNLKPFLEAEKQIIKNDYLDFFNIKRTRLSVLAISHSTKYKNEAFHLAMKVLLELSDEDSLGSKNDERLLLQALSTIRKCCHQEVLEMDNVHIERFLMNVPSLLKSRPWITPQIVALLGVLDSCLIKENVWLGVIEILLNEKFNTYSWQCYHLWLLLAKHRYSNSDLSKYCSELLRTNDDSNKPVVAAVMIYMVSIDDDYRRIILSLFKKGFIRGDFQERLALIALRKFDPEDLSLDSLSLNSMHKSLHRFKEKPLVYVAGEISDESIDYELLQIYSL
jgi:hypothetical protein